YDVNEADVPCPRENVIHGMGASLNFFSFKKGRCSNFRTRAGLRCRSIRQPDSRKQIEWDGTMRRQVVQAADGPGDEAGEQGKP
ncbi:MAG: hypothetical protein WAT38_15970, partial [Nitrospira sp.]